MLNRCTLQLWFAAGDFANSRAQSKQLVSEHAIASLDSLFNFYPSTGPLDQVGEAGTHVFGEPGVCTDPNREG